MVAQLHINIEMYIFHNRFHDFVQPLYIHIQYIYIYIQYIYFSY